MADTKANQQQSSKPKSAAVGQFADEGLRVLLAEDLFIYVVRESDGLIFIYNTELWTEWAPFLGSEGYTRPVSAMIPFAHNHTPEPIAKPSCPYLRALSEADQMTLAEWEAMQGVSA